MSSLPDVERPIKALDKRLAAKAAVESTETFVDWKDLTPEACKAIRKVIRLMKREDKQRKKGIWCKRRRPK